jgi:hypothetical protein
VARLPIRSGPRRAFRFAELLALAQWAYERARELWDALDAREQDEVKRLLQKSQGRPANLTVAEQKRLRNLAIKAFTNRR